LILQQKSKQQKKQIDDMGFLQSVVFFIVFLLNYY
tara:strand:- start:341 stop:445 length:105 start_codon:yes stop_codon:yes gene_type:complete